MLPVPLLRFGASVRPRSWIGHIVVRVNIVTASAEDGVTAVTAIATLDQRSEAKLVAFSLDLFLARLRRTHLGCVLHHKGTAAVHCSTQQHVARTEIVAQELALDLHRYWMAHSVAAKPSHLAVVLGRPDPLVALPQKSERYHQIQAEMPFALVLGLEILDHDEFHAEVDLLMVTIYVGRLVEVAA